MSEKKVDDGGLVFPVFPESEIGHAAAYKGISLRDYLIAKFEAAWIVSLAAKFANGNSGDKWIADMAHLLATGQADNFISEKRRTERGGK